MCARGSRPRWSFLRAVTIAAVIASGCQRQSEQPPGFAGTWVATSGRRVMMVLTLRERSGTLVGRWAYPYQFSAGQSGAFASMTSRVATSPIARAVVDGSKLHLTVPDPDDPNEINEFVMTLDGAGERAALQFTGAPIAPWSFARYHGNVVPVVSTDWDPSASYKLDGVELPSSAPMLAIFQEDQKVRQNLAALDDIGSDAMRRSDKERRTETAALLERGELHSGADFRRAAFVFQHGDTPDDYLLAHTLAVIATSKGDAEGPWIASATLDRYLHSLHQPQIYGTQFDMPFGKPATQDPYDRTLVSDSLRSVLGVPSLAAQRDQLADWQKQADGRR